MDDAPATNAAEIRASTPEGGLPELPLGTGAVVTPSYLAPSMQNVKAQNEAHKVLAACEACRKQRKRCSGLCPCEGCLKRGVQCVFETLRRRRGPAGGAGAGTDRTVHIVVKTNSEQVPEAHSLVITTESGVSATQAIKVSAPADAAEHGAHGAHASGGSGALEGGTGDADGAVGTLHVTSHAQGSSAQGTGAAANVYQRRTSGRERKERRFMDDNDNDTEDGEGGAQAQAGDPSLPTATATAPGGAGAGAAGSAGQPASKRSRQSVAVDSAAGPRLGGGRHVRPSAPSRGGYHRHGEQDGEGTYAYTGAEGGQYPLLLPAMGGYVHPAMGYALYEGQGVYTQGTQGAHHRYEHHQGQEEQQEDELAHLLTSTAMQNDDYGGGGGVEGDVDIDMDVDEAGLGDGGLQDASRGTEQPTRGRTGTRGHRGIEVKAHRQQRGGAWDADVVLALAAAQAQAQVASASGTLGAGAQAALHPDSTVALRGPYILQRTDIGIQALAALAEQEKPDHSTHPHHSGSGQDGEDQEQEDASGDREEEGEDNDSDSLLQLEEDRDAETAVDDAVDHAEGGSSHSQTHGSDSGTGPRQKDRGRERERDSEEVPLSRAPALVLMRYVPRAPNEHLFRLGPARVRLISDFFRLRNIYAGSLPVVNPQLFFAALHKVKLDQSSANVLGMGMGVGVGGDRRSHVLRIMDGRAVRVRGRGSHNNRGTQRIDAAGEPALNLHHIEAESEAIIDGYGGAAAGFDHDDDDEEEDEDGANGEDWENSTPKAENTAGQQPDSTAHNGDDASAASFRVLYLTVLAMGAIADGRTELGKKLYVLSKQALAACVATPRYQTPLLAPAIILLSSMARIYNSNWKEVVSFMGLLRSLANTVPVPEEARIVLSMPVVQFRRDTPRCITAILPPIQRPAGQPSISRMASIVDAVLAIVYAEFDEWSLGELTPGPASNGATSGAGTTTDAHRDAAGNSSSTVGGLADNRGGAAPAHAQGPTNTQTAAIAHVEALLDEVLTIQAAHSGLRPYPLPAFVTGITALLQFKAGRVMLAADGAQRCITQAAAHPLAPQSAMVATMVYRLLTVIARKCGLPVPCPDGNADEPAAPASAPSPAVSSQAHVQAGSQVGAIGTTTCTTGPGKCAGGCVWEEGSMFGSSSLHYGFGGVAGLGAMGAGGGVDGGVGGFGEDEERPWALPEHLRDQLRDCMAQGKAFLRASNRVNGLGIKGLLQGIKSVRRANYGFAVPTAAPVMAAAGVSMGAGAVPLSVPAMGLPPASASAAAASYPHPIATGMGASPSPPGSGLHASGSNGSVAGMGGASPLSLAQAQAQGQVGVPAQAMSRAHARPSFVLSALSSSTGEASGLVSNSSGSGSGLGLGMRQSGQRLHVPGSATGGYPYGSTGSMGMSFDVLHGLSPSLLPSGSGSHGHAHGHRHGLGGSTGALSMLDAHLLQGSHETSAAASATPWPPTVPYLLDYSLGLPLESLSPTMGSAGGGSLGGPLGPLGGPGEGSRVPFLPLSFLQGGYAGMAMGKAASAPTALHAPASDESSTITGAVSELGSGISALPGHPRGPMHAHAHAHAPLRPSYTLGGRQGMVRLRAVGGSVGDESEVTGAGVDDSDWQ